MRGLVPLVFKCYNRSTTSSTNRHREQQGAAMPDAHILVVEDDQHIREALIAHLSANSYQVSAAVDGSAALKLAQQHKPDLVILDVMLPGMDGMEVCRQLHNTSDCFILMLTARGEEIDKVLGLALGADDYMTKPFSPRELLARVQAILRRSRRQLTSEPQRAPLRFEHLLIDPIAYEVWHHGALVELTPREFNLLYALAEQPGHVLTREQLLDRIWGQDFVGIDRVVDVHIGILRRKLQDDPNHPQIIQTIRGIGYKFIATPAKRMQQRGGL